MPDEEMTTETMSDQETTQAVVESDEQGGIPTYVSEDDTAQEPASPEADSRQDVSTSDPDSGVDDGLLRWAADEGFSAEEVERFGADAMRNILTRMDQQIASRVRQTFGDNGQRRGAESQQRQDQRTTETPGRQRETPEKFQIDKRKFEDLDPVIPEQLEQINDYYHGQLSQRDEYISQLEQRVDGIVANLQQKQQMADLAEFDSAIDGLGDAYADDFGKGSSMDIEPHTRFGKNRMEVMEMVGALRQANPKSPISRLVPRAVNAVLGDKIKKIAQREVRDKAKQASSQATGRGKQTRTAPRQSSPEENHDAIVNAWNRYLNKPG